MRTHNKKTFFCISFQAFRIIKNDKFGTNERKYALRGLSSCFRNDKALANVFAFIISTKLNRFYKIRNI